MIRSDLPLIAACLALAGCGTANAPLAMQAASANPNWRAIATDDDHQRLRGWSATWTTALDDVRKGGAAAALTSGGALFNPEGALAKPMPPAGEYHCRWYKLGSTAPAVAAFTAYPAVPCRIESAGKVLRFSVLRGPQRPIGLIFDDAATRAVFLGTLVLGDETAPLDYGRDEKRDMAGYVERIGDARWRLVLPQPHFESALDVIEITPAA